MVVFSRAQSLSFRNSLLIWNQHNRLIYLRLRIIGDIAMPELSSVVSSELASYYEGVRDKVHELVAPISTEQLWIKPYPYGNSIGHLLLHLTGNLNHYIGATIAHTGYIRNRPLEFSDASKRPKEKVLADFDAAISMVASTIRRQSAQDWVAPYSDPTDPDTHTRFGAFLRMAAHAYHHVGQIIYLSKELTSSAS
jgi:uncharacterized damage-inducible protein DinB